MADNLDPTEVRSFGTGALYLGDVGATEVGIEDAEWVGVGHVADTGSQISLGKTLTAIRSWQSYPDPVRMIEGESTRTLAFTLLQWNAHNLAFALGGGEWTEVNGFYRYVPPAAGTTDYRAAVLDAVDGDVTYRILFRRTQVQSSVDFTVAPTAEAPLPITLTVLAAEGGDAPFEVFTNDPAAASLGS